MIRHETSKNELLANILSDVIDQTDALMDIES
jgi:hypothetical protein